MNPACRIAFRERTLRHGFFSLRVQRKRRVPCGYPPLLPLGDLSAAVADQQPVVVEALTTAGFAVLV